MNIDKLKNKFSTGAFVADVKHYFSKINEIIDWINNIGTPSYKVYTGLLSQSGTSAPSVIILENTIGDIVWTRSSAGNYYGTLTGAFTEDKTFINGNSNSENGTYYSYNLLGGGGVLVGYYGFAKDSNDVILFQTIDSATNNAVEASTLLPGNTTVPIEIRVYN